MIENIHPLYGVDNSYAQASVFFPGFQESTDVLKGFFVEPLPCIGNADLQFSVFLVPAENNKQFIVVDSVLDAVLHKGLQDQRRDQHITHRMLPLYKKVDLVLTDMSMPVMNGAELAAEIRKMPRFAELPIYVITADVEMQNEYKQMGFNDMLIKPVTLDKLKELLAKFSSQPQDKTAEK